jgi:hypothetical protein
MSIWCDGQESDGLTSSADMGSGRISIDEQKRWLRVRSLVAKSLHRLVTLAHASTPAPEVAPVQVRLRSLLREMLYPGGGGRRLTPDSLAGCTAKG